MIHVLLRADYGASPLWLLGEHGFVSVAVDQFSLSPALAAELADWSDAFQSLKQSDYEWPATEDREAWTAHGSRLVEEIAGELGPGYCVSYEV